MGQSNHFGDWGHKFSRKTRESIEIEKLNTIIDQEEEPLDRIASLISFPDRAFKTTRLQQTFVDAA